MSEPRNPTDSRPIPAERVAAWESIPRLFHGFYGRSGGHSDGPFASLNLSLQVGDDADSVSDNWRDLQRELGGANPVRMTQVHGAAVRVVSGAEFDGEAGECDGLATRVAGFALSVLTADCVPILMVAPVRGAAMALHAGWRGTVAGIAAAGLAVARQEFAIEPDEWHAALGPAIGGCCYEVESTIGDELTSRWGDMPDAWQPARSRGQLDLRSANAAILARHGVAAERISRIGSCTACDHLRYFSHRRSGGRTGRQASVIGFHAKSALSPSHATGRLAP